MQRLGDVFLSCTFHCRGQWFLLLCPTMSVTSICFISYMSDMKINNIFSISSLNTDGKWFVWMKCEGNQTASSWRRISPLQTSINLEFEQTRVPGIKSARKRKKEFRKSLYLPDLWHQVNIRLVYIKGFKLDKSLIFQTRS